MIFPVIIIIDNKRSFCIHILIDIADMCFQTIRIFFQHRMSFVNVNNVNIKSAPTLCRTIAPWWASWCRGLFAGDHHLTQPGYCCLHCFSHTHKITEYMLLFLHWSLRLENIVDLFEKMYWKLLFENTFPGIVMDVFIGLLDIHINQ